MPKIAAKISTELRGQVAGETILKYFNEYKMHGCFKENMWGKHDRLFFLDIFNYTKRWEFFLKYAKKTVSKWREHSLTHAEIELMRKKMSTHRNIVEQERKFIRETWFISMST